jgi:hypothetical protein
MSPKVVFSDMSGSVLSNFAVFFEPFPHGALPSSAT